MVPRSLLIHPGEVLREEFMRPYGISQNALGRALGIDPRRVNLLVAGKRAVTLDTALRLACYFGTSPEFWLRLQARHDLEAAGPRMAQLRRTIPPLSPSAPS